MKYLLLVIVIGAITQFALSSLLTLTLSQSGEERGQQIAKMQIHEPVRYTVVPHATPNPDPLLPGESILERVRRRGIIRVGYNEDKLPFAYINSDGSLVGLDIDLVHAFARDLDVDIEFVRFDRGTLVEQLANDEFDVVMSGLVGTLERSEKMQHTDSHMAVTLSLVVEDYRVRKFFTISSIQRTAGLRIGFVDLSRGYINRLREALPNAALIELTTSQEFFEGKDHDLDALLVSAESGSAYTLLYPEFEVVVPKDFDVSLPLFYAIGNHDEIMTDFLEHWITLRRKDGTFSSYYDHWILGKTSSNKRPRWCVARDVLGWVE